MKVAASFALLSGRDIEAAVPNNREGGRHRALDSRSRMGTINAHLIAR